jgi:DNA repair exonuclease SbcCD ATPase subunit
MRISSLEVGGFGRLKGPFSFGAGLNIVVGDNETGKSTLHDALIRALFGFSRSERRMTQGRTTKDGRKPWGGGPFGLTVALEEVHWRGDGTGKPVRVEWDFDTHTVRAWHDGNEVTREVLGKGNKVMLGPALLGLDLNEFCQACTLGQDRIAAVVRSDGLTSALTKAVESSSSDVRVDDAVERMGKFLDGLGITRAALKPSSSGVYAFWLDRQAALQLEVQRYDTARPQLAEAAHRLAATEEEERLLADARRVLERRLFVAELAASDEKLAKITSLRETVAERPAAPVTLDEDTLRALDVARVQLQEARTAHQSLADDAAEAKPKLIELRSRQRELEGKIEVLAAYEDTKSSALDEVGSLWSRLQGLPPTETRPAETAPSVPPPPTLRRGRLLVGAAAIAVASLVAAALITPVAAAGLLIAALVAYRGLRKSAPVSSMAVGEPRATQDERADLQRMLTDVLDKVEAPPGELAERASAYLVACRKHGELLQHRVDLGNVTAEITLLAEPERGLTGKDRELAGLATRIADAYRALGIHTEDLDVAASELEQRKAQARSDAQREAAAKQATEQIELLLAGKTEVQLRSERDASEQRLREHTAQHGELDEQAEEPSTLREQIATAAQRMSELAVEGANRKNEFELLKTGFTLPPAEMREKLDEATAAVAEIDAAKKAISIARQTLLAAGREARKNFRPVLEHALSEALPLVTDGRYAEANVDDELRVSVIAPETGKREPAEALSRGTQDQIFLVERLAVAQVLDQTGGVAPLFLDDPFAHFDSTRFKLGLKLLDEVARTRQVILFSESAEIVASAREACDPCTFIELPAPTERAPTPAARLAARAHEA